MQQTVLLTCLIGFAIIATMLLVLRLLVRASGASLRLRRIRHLHRDQKGGVQSLSFVLTLPIFIMIMMGIVQASQIMIAQIVVEYAALTAARAAAVWIPVHLADYESDGRNRIANIYSVGQKDGGTLYRVEVGTELGETYSSPKTLRIAMAAAQACMPIAPSRNTGADTTQTGSGAYRSLVRAYDALAAEDNAAASRRIRNKLAYSLAQTRIQIEVFHPDEEPPLQEMYEDVDQFDRIYVTETERISDGSPSIRPCRDQEIPTYHSSFVEDSQEYQQNEIGWQDEITVTVRHDLALLPGPGRMLSRMINSQYYNDDYASDEISETIRREGGVYTWPLTAKATISNEGLKSVIRYDHSQTGLPY